MQQLAPACAEIQGVSAAATALESEALKDSTGLNGDMHGPSIAENAAAAASGPPASAADASTTAGDISVTATDESATAADKFTAAAVECKSTTMCELRVCLVASIGSMPERLDTTPGSHGQLSSVDAWLATLGGTSSRLATARMSDLVLLQYEVGHLKHGHAGDATNKPQHQSIRQEQAMSHKSA